MISIVINKPGIDINEQEYPFLFVELNPQIELHYDRVSIKSKCYKGVNIDNNEYSDKIIPKNWDRLYVVKVPYEKESENDMNEWVTQKFINELTSKKHIPYEYLKYEDDVFDLDETTGEPKLNAENKPILLYKKGELIKKRNGTYKFYTKIIDEFCELEDIKRI
jgi:hypothetical protein